VGHVGSAAAARTADQILSEERYAIDSLMREFADMSFDDARGLAHMIARRGSGVRE